MKNNLSDVMHCRRDALRLSQSRALARELAEERWRGFRPSGIVASGRHCPGEWRLHFIVM